MAAPKTLLAIAMLIASLGGGAATAGAEAPGEVAALKIPGCPLEGSAHLAPAPGEGVLVRTCGSGDRIGSTLSAVLPSGALVRHPVPAAGAGPIAVGPAGEIWAAENPEYGPDGEGRGGEVAIDRVAPDGTVERFPLGPSPESVERKVVGLAIGVDGTAWAATGEPMINPGGTNASVGGELIRIAPDGSVSRFRVPGKFEPQGLAMGPDGNLWFTGVERRYETEHTFSPGTGRIGRMTPTGEFRLSPGTLGIPGAIAAGPDGRLWFTETAKLVNQVGTIDTAGSLGEVHFVHWSPQGGLAFGPEGDAWLSTASGLVRMTPSGGQTIYPGSPEGVAVDAEGDIWALERDRVTRVTPGGSGIDVVSVASRPGSRKVDVVLACGGPRRCQGILELAVRGAKGTAVRLARVRYSVPGEAMRARALTASPAAYALARRYPHGVPLNVHATVAGGPVMDRRARVHSFLRK
jgi:sugar lactone lactonase YvrE